MLAHFVEAQATGLALGIATCGPQRSQVVVAVDEYRAVELGQPVAVGRADEGMKCQRRRPITVGELVDQLPDPRRICGSGHGFFGGNGMTDFGGVLPGGTGAPGVPAAARLDVLSDRGSM